MNNWMFKFLFLPLTCLFFVLSAEEDKGNSDLKEFEWLVGTWKDAEEGVDITNTFEWRFNKHFLVQHFKMQFEDEDELEGWQVIGYDPATKNFRSWVFDSDGGFGESVIGKEGKNWYSSLVFTLPDGRKSTATNSFTQIDANTYSFSSENRDLDGTLLPDVGPFKFVRKQ